MSGLLLSILRHSQSGQNKFHSSTIMNLSWCNGLFTFSDSDSDSDPIPVLCSLDIYLNQTLCSVKSSAYYNVTM